ncbi:MULTISPECIES: biotin--[acetyl-CoA-carboxylase] ligase [Actinomyces]|uniref:biotin--[biotin carboxyl-carrier protein] ligase n=1 Tax=Actinomyces respiraculi TaxID=2744574 RepID=A0A7T0LL68_9ACTO|nr:MULTISPECIES: biotin--[acetyl-CoA-carboxylase] ligase [Actinomyces]QPL05794.1 biotin--[acetyl-CoA-carboxylase] ligase [Actinomyces respiraculi]
MSETTAPDVPARSGSDPAEPCPAPALTPLVTVARTGSTNSDLIEALARDPRDAQRRWPHLSALRAVHQTAGRGRAGRSWITPGQEALTLSVVLRPLVPADRLPWLPLVAGLAVRDALSRVLTAEGSTWTAWTKWPNDVLLLPPDQAPAEEIAGWGRARKVGGLLTEVAHPAHCAPTAPTAPTQRPVSRDEAAAVVLGIGLNVGQERAGLPVSWAGSLALAGVHLRPQDLLAPLAVALAARTAQWERDDGDPGAPLLGDLRAACLTLGQTVHVEMPGGDVAEGRALDLEPGLVVESSAGRRVVAAGDVIHMRNSPAHTPEG